MISYSIIHDIIMSTLIVHALQPPILPRHSVLMQLTTDQWNFDEEHDFTDQGPLTDMDMEENAEMLALMLRHNSHSTIPYCFKDAGVLDTPPSTLARSGTGATAAGSTR